MESKSVYESLFIPFIISVNKCGGGCSSIDGPSFLT